MIEAGRRVIGDVGTLRHIARRLGIPVHVLGVTELDDATFVAMLQFADSVLGLAEIARRSGRVIDAINELWPLVARLEARAADGFVDRESLALLGRARVSLGVALGTLLPEEKLATAAKWTGQALVVAERLDDASFLAYALAMHGNELRKAGRIGAAIERLRRSIALSSDAQTRASACALLARAAGEAGHAELFDSTMDGCRRQLDQSESTGMLSNHFTFREVLLRGLVATGRATEAARLMEEPPSATAPAAPQWTVIERVTASAVLLATGEREGAEKALRAALAGAEIYRLPHQVQRAIRVAGRDVDAITQAGRSVLDRLSSKLSVPGLVSDGGPSDRVSTNLPTNCGQQCACSVHPRNHSLHELPNRDQCADLQALLAVPPPERTPATLSAAHRVPPPAWRSDGRCSARSRSESGA